MKFKGFNDWIEIFRGGKQTDSRGKEHNGDELIQKAVETFDPGTHEPPLVLGHPKDDAPAYGWVEGLKTIVRDGVTVLLARFKDVVPEFEEAVKQGLWKKRSIRLGPDGVLRHVGFLGAVPPAVKGLADLKFEDDPGAVTFDFYDPGLGTLARLFRNLRDWLIEKEGKDKADEIIPDWDVTHIQDLANQPEPETETGPAAAYSEPAQAAKKEEKTMSFKDQLKTVLGKAVDELPNDGLPEIQDSGGSFSEADIRAATKRAEEETRKKMEAEFAEKQAAERREAREKEVSDWCEQMVKEGKLTPALVKYGLPEILKFLAASEDVIEFGEAREKVTAFDRLKALFETELPKLVEFNEVATRDKDVAGDGAAAKKINDLISQKMKENRDLAYQAAFAEVQREHPDLALEYAQEIRGE